MWNIVQRISLESSVHFILNLSVYMSMTAIKYEVVYQIFQNLTDKFVLYILQYAEKSIEQGKYIKFFEVYQDREPLGSGIFLDMIYELCVVFKPTFNRYQGLFAIRVVNSEQNSNF